MFGVPSNLVPHILFPGTAPNVNPNGYGGGGGGGSNWTALTTGNFNTKREFQTSHSVTGSLTKIRGKWVHKGGMEFRNLLSNYHDPEQGSVAMPSPFAHQGGNFNFEYVTASGGVANLVTTNAQRGVNAAGMLLGTGVWWIRPGANVAPAFSQKYFAIYSQNDWRPTSKLTVNLGLRWEVQPGPTERFDRMSSWDFTEANSFGSAGAIAFPGEDGYSRNLWDTTYDNWGPRVGAAYQWNDKTVAARRLRRHLPADQHRLLLGSDRLRLRKLLGRRAPAGVRHQPGRRAGDPVLGSSADLAGPWRGRDQPGRVRHRRGALRPGPRERAGAAVELLRGAFTRQPLDGVDRLHGVVQQATCTTARSRSRTSRASIPAILADWRAQYIASNGTLNPATQLVQNPIQPATGPLVPFAGVLGQRTIARQNTLLPVSSCWWARTPPSTARRPRRTTTR